MGIIRVILHFLANVFALICAIIIIFLALFFLAEVNRTADEVLAKTPSYNPTVICPEEYECKIELCEKDLVVDGATRCILTITKLGIKI